MELLILRSLRSTPRTPPPRFAPLTKQWHVSVAAVHLHGIGILMEEASLFREEDPFFISFMLVWCSLLNYSIQVPLSVLTTISSS